MSSKRWWQEEGAAEAGFDFETSGGNEGDDDEDYVETGSEWIGRPVRRTFGRNVVSYGVVVSWLPAEKNDGRAFYRVRHDDGDEEDLDEDEVGEAARGFEECPKVGGGDAPASGGGAPSSDGADALGDGESAPEPPADFGHIDRAPEEIAKRRPTCYLAACWKGLSYLAELGESEVNLVGFGADLCLAFHDVASTARDGAEKRSVIRRPFNMSEATPESGTRRARPER